ncbi:hypothetical protein HK405_000255 [Cladochytrium tenue]|nr:hypothetical protein HK405_000255 [Cladochytrium tenue]
MRSLRRATPPLLLRALRVLLALLLALAAAQSALLAASWLTERLQLPTPPPPLPLPGPRLAVAIPFTAHDASRVLANLREGWDRHPPCAPSDSRRLAPTTELILYFDGRLLDVDRGELSRELLTAAARWTLAGAYGHATGDARVACFASVRYLDARLSPAESTYPLGATRMFFQLVDELAAPDDDSDGQSLEHTSEQSPAVPGGRPMAFGSASGTAAARSRRALPDYLYYMEPDNNACRAGWLTQLHHEAAAGGFWLRGSPPRSGDAGAAQGPLAQHINGNALYALGDPRFARRFLLGHVRPRVLPPDLRGAYGSGTSGGPAASSYPPALPYLGAYDVAIDLIRRDTDIVGARAFGATAHLFQYTPTVQNWYRTPVNATELCSREPETFLVHGRETYF